MKRVVGKCWECGKDIIVIEAPFLDEEELKLYLENEDYHGVVGHAGIDGAIFHASCNWKMVMEGRWDWKVVKPKRGRKKKTDMVKANLKKLLDMDRMEGRLKHIKPPKSIEVELDEIEYDDVNKKLVIRKKASQLGIQSKNEIPLKEKELKDKVRMEDEDYDIVIEDDIEGGG